MSERKPVNPADIQKDLKEFIENKYGAQVVFPDSQPEGMSTGPPTDDCRDPQRFRSMRHTVLVQRSDVQRTLYDESV